MQLLQIKNLSFRIGGQSIFDGLDLSIDPREIHALVGTNGSGVDLLSQREIPGVTIRSRYISDFSLTSGRVGKLRIDYAVNVDAYAVAELTAKVFGHAQDEIEIREEAVLSGENARSLIKTRVALEGHARAEIIGVTEGKAKGARGHVDCTEIITDQAVAQAIPIVKVTHPLAKITHEAAIGSIDQKQLETSMAHGLRPEQAVEIVVAGLLR